MLVVDTVSLSGDGEGRGQGEGAGELHSVYRFAWLSNVDFVKTGESWTRKMNVRG